MLTHAEVQGHLGRGERGKGDFAWLPFDPSLFGPRVVGDRLRRGVQAVLEGERALPALSEPGDQPAVRLAQARELTAAVTAPTLNLRKVRGGAIVGSLPRGTQAAVLDHDRGRSEVRTPGGTLAFVASHDLTLDAGEDRTLTDRATRAASATVVAGVRAAAASPSIPQPPQAVSAARDGVLREREPTLQTLANSEPPWRSRVIRGPLLPAVGATVALIGMPIAAKLQNRILDVILVGVTRVSLVFGPALTLVGRLRARKPIGGAPASAERSGTAIGSRCLRATRAGLWRTVRGRGRANGSARSPPRCSARPWRNRPTRSPARRPYAMRERAVLAAGPSEKAVGWVIMGFAALRFRLLGSNGPWHASEIARRPMAFASTLLPCSIFIGFGAADGFAGAGAGSCLSFPVGEVVSIIRCS